MTYEGINVMSVVMNEIEKDEKWTQFRCSMKLKSKLICIIVWDCSLVRLGMNQPGRHKLSFIRRHVEANIYYWEAPCLNFCQCLDGWWSASTLKCTGARYSPRIPSLNCKCVIHDILWQQLRRENKYASCWMNLKQKSQERRVPVKLDLLRIVNNQFLSL